MENMFLSNWQGGINLEATKAGTLYSDGGGFGTAGLGKKATW